MWGIRKTDIRPLCSIGSYGLDAAILVFVLPLIWVLRVSQVRRGILKLARIRVLPEMRLASGP